jgi:hypothetical protein
MNRVEVDPAVEVVAVDGIGVAVVVVVGVAAFDGIDFR